MCGQIIGPYHAIAYEEPRNSLVSESFQRPLSPGFNIACRKAWNTGYLGMCLGMTLPTQNMIGCDISITYILAYTQYLNIREGRNHQAPSCGQIFFYQTVKDLLSSLVIYRWYISISRHSIFVEVLTIRNGLCKFFYKNY